MKRFACIKEWKHQINAYFYFSRIKYLSTTVYTDGRIAMKILVPGIPLRNIKYQDLVYLHIAHVLGQEYYILCLLKLKIINDNNFEHTDVTNFMWSQIDEFKKNLT